MSKFQFPLRNFQVVLVLELIYIFLMSVLGPLWSIRSPWPLTAYIYKTFSSFTIKYFKRASLMKCIGLCITFAVLSEKKTPGRCKYNLISQCILNAFRYVLFFLICINPCNLKHVEIIAVTSLSTFFDSNLALTYFCKTCNIDVYLVHLPQLEFFKSIYYIVSFLKIVMLYNIH